MLYEIHERFATRVYKPFLLKLIRSIFLCPFIASQFISRRCVSRSHRVHRPSVISNRPFRFFLAYDSPSLVFVSLLAIKHDQSCTAPTN